ncbi:NAAT family transporter [bacterium]|nr:NAAT family transporter [bacterium]
MNTYTEFALVVFTSFLTLINPFGILPVYLTMTAELSPKARRWTAIRANAVAYLVLLLFAFTGQFLFGFFGISVDSFRVVGGIIFFMLGMDMLQARLSRIRVPKNEVKAYVGDISITPLAIPMITGPGSITNAIVLMEDAHSFGLKAVLVLVMAGVLGLNLLGLLFAAPLSKWLGETGNNVMMRLMGLIVMVIAVEFFFSGLGPLIRRFMAVS